MRFPIALFMKNCYGAWCVSEKEIVVEHKKMNNYTWDYIQKHPQETKRLLGIDYEQLEKLLEQGKLLHQRKREKIEEKKRCLLRMSMTLLRAFLSV